jgi:enolase
MTTPVIVPKISKCIARKVIDSRGMATLEVEVSAGELDVTTARASVPSGENVLGGEGFSSIRTEKGILDAIEHVEKIIAPKILKAEVDSSVVDQIMFRLDMTPEKTKIGMNAMLGVSMAVSRLEAKIKNVPLWKLISMKTGATPGKPLLYMSVFTGGRHADFRLPFEEYVAVVGGETFAASYEKAKNIFDGVREKLTAEGAEYYMSDEGEFSPQFESMEKPFEVLSECIAGKPDVFLGINVAASQFYKNEKYELLGASLGRGELLFSYKPLIERFNVKSIEDPFAVGDEGGFEEAVRWFGSSALIVAGDFTATDPSLVEISGKKQLANAVVVRPIQIGTMSEVYDAIRTARKYEWKIIVSQGFGETLDPFIADLAVGVGAYGIKAGAPVQLEHVAKYERLMEIEKEMIEQAAFEEELKKKK